MARLTRNSILAVKPRTQTIEVPEWGGDVEIQELTLSQQQLIARSMKKDDASDVAIKTFLEGVSDPKFDASDAEALANQGIAAFQRVVNAIVDLSGMSNKSQAAIAGK